MNLLKKTGIVFINICFWAYFIITCTVLVIIGAFLRIVTIRWDPNLKILQQFSCFWGSLYLWANPFWSLKKSGLHHVDKKKAYVIVANHQSMADIITLLNTFLHFKWIAKKSLFYFPLLGWNMMLNGYIPIDRGNPHSREECMQKCRDWLAKGSSILFFPEGTRSMDGTLLPFKPGAFRLAIESGHDILPIVIQGSLHAIPKHSILLHGKSNMTVEVLAPIKVAPFQVDGPIDGSKKLADFVRLKMEERVTMS